MKRFRLWIGHERGLLLVFSFFILSRPPALFPRSCTSGPTWQTNDGSKVMGTILNSVPNPNAIPSLLLAATSHDGCGLLSKVLFIQRVDTVGGTAPGESCDLSHGSELPVDYMAVYRFYGPAS